MQPAMNEPAGPVPPARRKRQGLRHLSPGRRGARSELERRCPAHQGVRRVRDHRQALLDLLSGQRDPTGQARLRAARRDRGGPLRRGRLAHPERWDALLGERRHHGAARRQRSAGRLRQGHARSDRAEAGRRGAREPPGDGAQGENRCRICPRPAPLDPTGDRGSARPSQPGRLARRAAGADRRDPGGRRRRGALARP